MNSTLGFVRVAAVSQKVIVGDVEANFKGICETLNNDQIKSCDIVVFQEHVLSGYTVGDLFFQNHLIDAVANYLKKLEEVVADQVVVVGAVVAGNYNCAIVLNNNKIVGILPKTYLPNYKEFYEARWFRSGNSDTIFVCGDLKIGGEVCEDLFVPIPPSSYAAKNGAAILFNCSASPEQVGKHRYRRDLVVQQSGRCMAAYVYSSSGPSESTSDLVFGGVCLIAENGRLIAESARVGNGLEIACETHWVIADVDYQKLLRDRAMTNTFQYDKTYKQVKVYLKDQKSESLYLNLSKTPFVPDDEKELEERCTEIFDIQTAGLKKRVELLKPKMAIGISGGLDSTLAALCMLRVCKLLEWDVKEHISGLTMPGFATSKRTKDNAIKFCELTGIPLKEVDIRQACLETFRSMGYKPFGLECDENFEENLAKLPKDLEDLCFENVQARHRTLLLMTEGFVIGTGDMSELAIGWCTYNGDHMSNYNVNCTVPKTLVKFLIKHIAKTNWNLTEVLNDIVGTPISPELLPNQDSEGLVGPYELHDFFLFHVVRNGFSPQKVLTLAGSLFKTYTLEEIRHWLKVFYTRFFANQFKRNCVPDGPKVGSLSLSPRGDWRMPSDASVRMWLEGV